MPALIAAVTAVSTALVAWVACMVASCAVTAWYWPIGLSLLGMFIVAVAITKFVSVGSLAAAIGLPIAACVVFLYSSLGLKFCMAVIGITVVWAHRANIKKLMTGKESKLSFTKRVTEPDDK